MQNEEKPIGYVILNEGEIQRGDLYSSVKLYKYEGYARRYSRARPDQKVFAVYLSGCKELP